MSGRPLSPADLERLAASSLFAGLDAAARDEILLASDGRALAAGATLFRQGDRVENMFLVARGRLKLSQVGPEGDEMVMKWLGPGEMLSGVAVLGPRPYPVTALATEATVVRGWGRELLAELCARHPRLRDNALATIADRMQDSLSRLREMAGAPAPQRLAAELLRIAQRAGRQAPGGIELPRPLSRQILAEMTGTSLYTVSRLLAAWAREGWVAVGRERVTLAEPARLRRIAAGGDGDASG